MLLALMLGVPMLGIAYGLSALGIDIIEDAHRTPWTIAVIILGLGVAAVGAFTGLTGIAFILAGLASL